MWLGVGSVHRGGGVDVVGDAGVGDEWCKESDCVIDGSDVEG